MITKEEFKEILCKAVDASTEQSWKDLNDNVPENNAITLTFMVEEQGEVEGIERLLYFNAMSAIPIKIMYKLILRQVGPEGVKRMSDEASKN